MSNPPQGGPPPGMMPPGQQPSPEQIRLMQQQLAAEAQKHGLSPEQYIERLRQQAMQQRQMQQQGGGPQGRPGPPGAPPGAQPIQPGPPKPEALAVAKFLMSQELKHRTVIHDEKRKQMFRVKRAIRALQSPAYQKARSKNPLLPAVTDRASAENTFKQLPLSLLALRVSKVDAHAHEGHNHAKPKRIKGLWTVKIEQHQDAEDDSYYIWLYEGSQWKMKLYAVGAVAFVIAIVLFPLWPLFLRQGVWYLSMGMLGLIGLFFVMAIFRLILFIVTMFAAPPGLWLYPNLFEDVGFFDSFRPVWAWQETADDIKAKKQAKKEKRAAKKLAKAEGRPYKSSKKNAAAAASPATPSSRASTPAPASAPSAPAPASVPVDNAPQATGSTAAADPGAVITQRPRHATVEEGED
ncbi:translocation protein [Sporormia fimetaria CBS 119925]|uniref:Translocation protein SEC62 n=1 Tax=Sporormia fimetaria CBS 119925 TaxID=1340428 RepID=A0A6A6V4K3_9PLEO|nr:translocation protein [Sporormia fimetaria CBS 119925]